MTRIISEHQSRPGTGLKGCCRDLKKKVSGIRTSNSKGVILTSVPGLIIKVERVHDRKTVKEGCVQDLKFNKGHNDCFLKLS